jgi:hypothetical protein
VAGGYQQTEGNNKPDAADAHRAERNVSLTFGESDTFPLGLKINEVSGKVVGGCLRCSPEFQVSDSGIKGHHNAVELTQTLTHFVAEFGERA